MRNGVIVQMLISFEIPPPGLGSQSQWTFIGSDGIVESDSYGKVRLGRGDGWEDIFEMPPFALNADVYSPIRLTAFAEQTQQFAQAVQAGYDAPPGFHGEDGRAAVEVVEARPAILRDSGEAVHLPIEPGLTGVGGASRWRSSSARSSRRRAGDAAGGRDVPGVRRPRRRQPARHATASGAARTPTT